MPALMDLVTRETGKPLAGLNGVGAGMEVGGAIAWARATAALELPVETVQDDAVARVEVHRKPLGVVGSITPWNWPLMIAVWHVMPALLAGNTVVVKPSALTPLATLRLIELANGVLPPGVLNVVTGRGGVGSAIANHPGIDKIVFTGSTPTGKRIMEGAAVNLKRLTLELGGNDAGIVLPDVDPKAVAPALFSVAFHNNGQTCACLKRLYVHESIYDALCAELARIAEAAVVGDGLAPGTELGPLQNRAQLDFVMELADDAHANGARLLSGGVRVDGPGYFYRPTVVADIADGARLVDEEQFGPILPVIRYRDVDEAVARANANPNGLGGSIWSNDLERAAALARRLECGTAWVNEHGAIQPDAPFGGVKQSGIGVEFGAWGLHEFTSIQTLKVMKPQAAR
jgi:acyl-CoA reductase-like NAD-dependent aldehyde dehydrogenase